MVDTTAVGKPLPPETVMIERGPLSNFAKAVTDDNPIYQDIGAAQGNGFDNIPAPPTYGFAMANWGKFPELQPEGVDSTSPIMQAIGSLMAKGGLILHGEQEFIYHRPVVAGDVLSSTGKISDIYEKEGSGGKTMTFVVTETVWSDESGEPVLTTRMSLIHRA
jgi:acyl dehydratase